MEIDKEEEGQASDVRTAEELAKKKEVSYRKMLHRCFLEYLLKKRMFRTAAAFQKEAKFTVGDIDIKDPAGFIQSILYNAYSMRVKVDATTRTASVSTKVEEVAGLGTPTKTQKRIKSARRLNFEKEEKHPDPGNAAELPRDTGKTAKILLTPFVVPRHRDLMNPGPDDRGFCLEKVMCGDLVTCCDFSRNGKWLAWTGDDETVGIMRFPDRGFTHTLEIHNVDATDVRFSTDVNIFATPASYNIWMWNATNRRKPMFKIPQNDLVQSVDFHPTRQELLCFSSGHNLISLWDIKKSKNISSFKGAFNRVRFQPQGNNYLAGACDKVVNIIDCDSQVILSQLKQHREYISCVCWDRTGRYIASLSEHVARIWSSDGKLMHKLFAVGDTFVSCVFHPGYDLLLVIGGDKVLNLWNPSVTNTPRKVLAHDNLIASLAATSKDELIASVSHDHSVKIWKLNWV